MERQAENVQEEALQGAEGPTLGTVAGIYKKCQQAIAAKHPKVSKLVKDFLELDIDSFSPAGLPVYQEDSITYEDAAIYYATAGELYYKLSLLLEYAGFPDAPIMYLSLEHALLDTGGRLCKFRIEPEEKKLFVMSEYMKLVGAYNNSSLLLAAPKVLPGPPRPMVTMKQALEFTYLGADTLFHLTRIGSVGAYIESGFLLPGMLEVPRMRLAYERMLEAYKDKVGDLVRVGC